MPGFGHNRTHDSSHARWIMTGIFRHRMYYAALSFSVPWRQILAVLCTGMAFHTAPAMVLAEGPSEYQVKAAFIYHFTQFIDWPQTSLGTADSPFRLCIVGPDPFGAILEETLQDKTVGGHPFSLIRNPASRELDRCHMLFLTKGHAPLRATLQTSLGFTQTLTVGEQKEFLEAGGMIQFYLEGQKIRFALNPNAVKLSELKVSPKLLRLAQIVTP